MKKLLLASAIILAGLSVIATASHADVSLQRKNSKYCRVSNSSDVLCKGRQWKATAAQGLAVTMDAAIESPSKYCWEDSATGDPLCEPKWKNDESEYLDPVYE